MKNLMYLFLFLYSFNLSAQKKAAGAINGSIADENSSPISYATISILSLQDDLISGTISDESGLFKLEEISFGTYKLKVEYLGYRDFEQSITIDKQNKKQTFDIMLSSNTEVLEEVIVRQEKSTVGFKLDKKEFLVGKDILSQGTDALEVLNQVPSVAVDPNGTVMLRGSSAVQILINGKRSGMTMNNALDQIPAEHIEKVEVITNPSASFDAQGSAGIINIVLKKNKLEGWNGQLRLKTGTPADHVVMPGINYKSNKFSAFANLRWRYSDYKGLYSTEQKTSLENGGLRSLNQNEKENRHDDGRSVYAGADFFPNEKSSITLAYYRAETKDTDETTLIYDIKEGQNNYNLSTLGNSEENRNYNQIELNYSHDLKKKGQKFNIDFQNDFWNSRKDWDLGSTGTFSSNSIANQLRTINASSSNDYVIASNYTHPITKESKLQLGVKLENRLVQSDYSAEALIESEWTTFAGINNKLDYKENIAAAYVQYSNKFKKFEYSFGLRSEYTDLNISDLESSFTSKRSYHNIFPSFHISTQLSEKHSMQLSYSRRINRPSLWSLYPFSNIKDFNQQDIGNPNLNAAFADALELGFLNIFEKITINSSIYFKDINDPTLYVVDYTETEAFVFKPINIEQRREAGFETSLNYRATKWLSMRGEFNFFYFDQNGLYNMQDLQSDGTYFSFRTSSDFKLKKKFSLSARYQYRSKELSPLFETLASSALSFGLNKSFLEDKINIGLSAFNVLDTRIQQTVARDPSYDFSYSSRRYGPRYSINFVYKFNQTEKDIMRTENRANRN